MNNVGIAEDGDLLVGGETDAASYSARTDAQGRMKWQRELAPNGRAHEILATPDNGCVVAGRTGTPVGQHSGRSTRTAASGRQAAKQDFQPALAFGAGRRLLSGRKRNDCGRPCGGDEDAMTSTCRASLMAALVIALGCGPRNHAPETPAIPVGPDYGLPDSVYAFSTSAFDPDGDSVAVEFDWGVSATTEKTGFMLGRTPVIRYARWRSPVSTTSGRGRSTQEAEYRTGHPMLKWRSFILTPCL